MKLFSFFALGILALGANAQPRIYPQTEARAASELAILAPAILAKRGQTGDADKIALARTLARLGREAGSLQAVAAISPQKRAAQGGAPQVRDEVFAILLARSTAMGKMSQAENFAQKINGRIEKLNAKWLLARAYSKLNDTKNARKSLFGAASLLTANEANKGFYTAQLLAQNGDKATARRLIERFKKQFPAPKNPYIDSFGDLDFTGYQLSMALASLGDWNGFVKIAAQDNGSGFLNGSEIERLLNAGQYELAIQETRRQSSPYNRLPLAVIGYALFFNGQKERAFALVEEAEKQIALIEASYEAWGEAQVKISARAWFAVKVAHVWREIGQAARAKALLQTLEMNSPAQQVTLEIAGMNAQDTLRGKFGSPVLSRQEWQQRAKNLENALETASLPEGSPTPFDVRWVLAKQLIRAGEKETARPLLEKMEVNAFRFPHGEKNQFPSFSPFNSLLQTLSLWRQIGDEGRVQNAIRQLLKMPDPKSDIRRRLLLLASHGFVSEAGAEAGKRGIFLDSKDLPFYNGISNPEKVPFDWPANTLQFRDSKSRFAVLTNFVRGLTFSLLSSQEDAFVNLQRTSMSF